MSFPRDFLDLKKSGNWGLDEIYCHRSHKGQCTSEKENFEEKKFEKKNLEKILEKILENFLKIFNVKKL